ncbi:MAG: CPXCG motif-containing cysteine-rich protein [Gammaproteobacteria bacterium]
MSASPGQELVPAYCPYCGEPIELLVDRSVATQQYIEDCSVCCRPIEISVEVAPEGDPQLVLKTEND